MGNYMELRELITDAFLMSFLDTLEATLGYTIGCAEMSKEKQEFARCSVSFTSEQKWILLYIDDAPPSQATLCHELVHILMWTEGWPAFILRQEEMNPNDIAYHGWNGTLQMLTCLILHIDLWKSVKDFGFDETEDYDSLGTNFLPKVVDCDFFNYLPPLIGRSIQAVHIAEGLLCPARDELKSLLRSAAIRTMPQALELADSICAVFEKHKPLSPQNCDVAFREVLKLINVPDHVIFTVYPDETYDGLRSSLLNVE